MQMEYTELISLAVPFISFGIGWVARYYAYIYANSKQKIRSIRQLIDNVDDALYDDKVNEEEFQKIFESAKAVIQK